MLTESDILRVLRDCYDPVLPCNIVDLGLIRSIVIVPDIDAPGTHIPNVPQKHIIDISLTPTQTTKPPPPNLAPKSPTAYPASKPSAAPPSRS